MKIFGRYHALLKTSCLREDTIERLHIKRRKGEKNDPFQDQYDHRLRSLLAAYYGTEQYRRITSRAFTGKYGGVTERFSSVNGRNCLVHLSNTAVNGPVTDGVLVDLGYIAMICLCEIIVRDAHRIYQFFTNGQCSCNDFFIILAFLCNKNGH